jgi:hypothetical protein
MEPRYAMSPSGSQTSTRCEEAPWTSGSRGRSRGTPAAVSWWRPAGSNTTSGWSELLTHQRRP